MTYLHSRKEITKKIDFIFGRLLILSKRECENLKKDLLATKPKVFVHYGNHLEEVKDKEKVEDVWQRRCTGCGAYMGMAHGQGCSRAGMSVVVIIEQTEAPKQSPSKPRIEPLSLESTNQLFMWTELKINEIIELLNSEKK